MRSQIFIGSSKEGLKFVSTFKQILEPIGEFTSWTDAFSHNRSALDSLVKRTKLSEFAILIATGDDLVLKRNEIKSVSRDNIIFEFGLFLGSTGVDRAFLLVEDTVTDLPSDLGGIELFHFSTNPEAYNYLDKVCTRILGIIQNEQAIYRMGQLPSTALALGYYNSFLKKLCQQLKECDAILIRDNKELRIKNCELHVIIPNALDDCGIDEFARLYYKQNDMETAQTIQKLSSQRSFPFQFKIDPANQDLNSEIEVKIFDIPTTLNTLVEAIKLIFPSDIIGNRDQEQAEQRELRNFANALRFLVNKNSLTKSIVVITDNVEI